MTLKIKSSECVYQGFFHVKRDVLEHASGHLGEYTSLVMPAPAAVILAQDEGGKWILNREYRHPIQKTVLGCSGGRLEPGEDPIEGARREFLEETGYFAEEIIFLGSCYQCPAIADQMIFYFFAKRAKKVREQKLDPLECIETSLLSFEEIEKELASGAPVDGSLCTALWFYSNKITLPDSLST